MSGSLARSLATILRSKANKVVAHEAPAIIYGNSVSQVSRRVPDPEVMPEVASHLKPSLRLRLHLRLMRPLLKKSKKICLMRLFS